MQSININNFHAIPRTKHKYIQFSCSKFYDLLKFKDNGQLICMTIEGLVEDSILYYYYIILLD